MEVRSRRNAEHYLWGDACDGWHLHRSAVLSVIEERVPPGTGEARHLHRHAEQCFYVLEGEAHIEVEGQEFVLRAGDSLGVPAGAAHRFFNAGPVDVRFLVISQPGTRSDREPA